MFQPSGMLMLIPQQLAPLPPWLTPSPQACCSWLGAQPSPAQSATAANASQNPVARSAGPNGSQPDLGLSSTLQQQQRQQGSQSIGAGSGCHAAGAAQANAEEGGLGGDMQQHNGAPAAKRPRLEPAMHRPASQGPSDITAAGTATQLEPALVQLQVFVQNGDITQLDQRLFVQLLSAVALQHAGGQAASTQHLLQQAQHQLQQLSADACQVLLEELLPSFFPAESSSSSGMQDAAVVQLTAPALAHLLTHALLPQLRSLGAAAPKSMLACLTLLGRSSAQGVLADSLLAPLVVSDGLLPVHAQLLVKLAKDTDSLQARLLDLLLVAALGAHNAAAPYLPAFAAHTAGSSCCCWKEPHVNLLKQLLDIGPQHTSQRLPAVVAALEAAVQHPALAKSTAFGQLIMSMLKTCAAALSKQQVEQLQAVVGRTATFLTKSLTSKLQQLLQQH